MNTSTRFSTLVLISASLLSIYLSIIITGQVPDNLDLNGYFNSTNWIVGKGRLYREVFSEYPLLANIIFSIVRIGSVITKSGLLGFSFIWVTLNGIIYCSVTILAVESNLFFQKKFQLVQLYAWLIPSAIFFALLRYDVYPAATSLLMMLSLRDKQYHYAALCLGITLALKGYAIFLLPTFFVYLIYQKNVVYATKMVLVAIAPFTLSLLIVFLFAGWEGLIAPFKFHALRDFNPDSSYQLINYYFKVNLHASEISLIPICLQLVVSAIGALIRPRDFYELVSAFSFVVIGFISFSVFYSGQFLLWVLPLLCFTQSKRSIFLLFTYSLFTLGYLIVSVYPLPILLITLITLLTGVRFCLMWSNVSDIIANRKLKIN